MTITAVVDLRAKFGAARDQDPRPTCAAFAVSDAHAAQRGRWDPLSTEWAYYHALQREGGTPDDGVALGTMLESIRLDGQPCEKAWPYIASDIVDIAAWQPPSHGETLYKRNYTCCPSTVPAIIAELDSQRPVVIAMYISLAFYVPKNGIIESSETVAYDIGHAVTAVGHGMRAKTSFVLIRNSWGDQWGANGYAWVSEDYLSPRVIGTATMTTEA